MRIWENSVKIPGKSLSVSTSTLSYSVYAVDKARRTGKRRTLNI